MITANGRIPKTMAGRIKFFHWMDICSPKSSTTYKLPVISKPVYSCKTKPNSQANKIAEKKEGILIPKVLIIAITLSNQVSL